MLLHVYNFPMDTANPAMLVSMEDEKKRVTEQLQQMKDKLAKDAGITVHLEARIGFAVEEIVKLSKEINCIIMGTQGEHLMLEKVFGTISTDVSQQAHCPVLLIPPDVSFKDYDDILFASDYSALEGKVLERILKFSKMFNAGLHFVHVNVGPDNPKTSPDELIFEKIFASKEPDTPMYFAEIEDTSVTDGLNKYISTHKIDLLVVVSQKRSFWERLFHKSVTKRMVLNSELPTLVLHTDDIPDTV